MCQALPWLPPDVHIIRRVFALSTNNRQITCTWDRGIKKK